MDQLPEELLDLVIDECDFTSLKHLRCACRTLARLTAPHIFEHVHIGMFTDSLRKLCSIAAHADLHKMVKRLTYHGELLPYFENRDEYAERIDMRPPFSLFYQMYCFQRGLPVLPSGDMRYREAKSAALAIWTKLPKVDPELDLDVYFRDYQSIWEEQQEWGEERSAILRRAICNLPNLEAADVLTQEMGMPKNHGPVWGRLLPCILQGPDDWKFIDSNEEASLGVSLDGAQQISHLLKALCERTGRPVRSLKFSTSNHVFWSQSTKLPLVHPSVWPEELGSLEVHSRVYDMRRAFRNLTHLELLISFDQNWDRRDLIGGGMKAFLHEAKSLENLHFGYSEETKDREDDRWDDPLQILGDIHWPALHTLHASFTTREHLLTDLFKRHASTLRHLSLVDMALAKAQGSWASIIEKIPHILKLEYIYVESLWDSTCEENGGAGLFEFWEGGAYERSIMDYCINGGQPPLIYPRDWNQAHPDQPTLDYFTPLRGSDSEENDASSDEEEEILIE
ncbi:chromatin modification-related protein eaf7 protein [Botryosphaeria dothidea]|uniref:Chromatin modification-related protein eaf7 protein n=1 Tax=Botryosphaeria dothidea TaxID=55169 RepID=A0A8H4J4J0_9PEZI|nr:chromatin modification-related protein eaf7 protein [Botryosphaeria dothidea]